MSAKDHVFTFGIEEEFQIIDPETRELVSHQIFCKRAPIAVVVNRANSSYFRLFRAISGFSLDDSNIL
jgi:hypothetical protein